MKWPFSRKRDVTWDSLSKAQQSVVARKIGGAALSLARRAHFGRGYEAVTSPFTEQRRGATVESRGEDWQMTPSQRNQLVNLQRDMMRNSPTRVMQDQQIRVNVVGNVGGKLYAAFPAEFKAAADEVVSYFNTKWFPRAEFTFRKSFNWILKTALTGQDVNGNVVLVFDDGILSGGDGTGRIRGFEGDEIGEVPDLSQYFPTGYTQKAGFVYNRLGMFCGVFVSSVQRDRLQRGRGTLDPSLGILKLDFDPEDDDALVNWILLGDMRRFNQGRAVSPLTSAVTALVDLHETVASEAQAAKLNAQLVGQILQDANVETDAVVPSAFDDEAPAGGALPAEVEFSTKELKAIGAHFDQMPLGMKIELMDTKRPNVNMPAYVEFVTGLIGGTRGLARVYSTLKAQTSYTAFRGEQVMTRPSFEEAQADLEREVCDWAARCVITRAKRLGLIVNELPDGWERMIAWNWPRMPEVSEKDAETARKMRLENGMSSLRRELGPGDYEKLMAERAAEKRDADEAGFIYPGTVTTAGQIKPDAEGEEDESATDETGAPEDGADEDVSETKKGGENA